jgi:hypothetical protein
MEIQFPIKIVLFTKNMSLVLSRKPKTAYFATDTKYINTSAGKTKIVLKVPWFIVYDHYFNIPWNELDCYFLVCE